MLDYSNLNFNNRLFLKKLEERDIILDVIPDTDIIKATLRDHTEYIHGTAFDMVSYIYVQMLEDKFYSKKIFESHGFSVSRGKVFGPDGIQDIKHYINEELAYPVVIKPTNAASGVHVYANLKNEDALNQAFTEISKEIKNKSILVESYFENGGDYRFFICKNTSEIAVVKRTPPKVVGDGRSTIAQLIEKENRRRMNPRNNCLCSIFIEDMEGKRCLKEQDKHTYDIPLKDEIVQLRYNANVSWGGECENVSDQIHPTFFKLIRDMFSVFPNLPFLFVDLLIKDCSLPVSDENYVYCESNIVFAGLSLFHLPSKGKEQDIINPMIDLIFPETINKEK
jgi:cyanophycin synthetase